MKNNKKGISAVVATVLIILITVAAVTIIWAAIIPMINNQLETATSCMDEVAFTVEEGEHTCFNGTDLTVQVGRGVADLDLADIQILISAGGNTQTLSLLSYTTLPADNEKRTVLIPTADITGGAAAVDEVSVAPIINIGVNTESCGSSIPVAIKAC